MLRYYKFGIRRPNKEKTMDKQECIIVDLEGTLTDCAHRIQYWVDKNYDKWNSLFSADAPSKQILKIIRENIKLGKKIIICTAKSEEHTEKVYDWLHTHYCSENGTTILSVINGIYFREMGDIRISTTVKEEMLQKIMKKYIVTCAYDDRPGNCEMYRKNGIKTVQITTSKKDKKQDIEPDAKWLGVEVEAKSGSPADLLQKAADLFEERDKAYGSSYKQFGRIVLAFFPDGITLKTEDDFTRWGLLNMIFSKMNRYCNNFPEDGHPDSLADMSVYPAMLAEIDKLRGV